MAASLPTSPSEEHRRWHNSRKRHSGPKSAKAVHRASKPASTRWHPTPHESHVTTDGRHKRVWKACERCRMKKMKCDGVFPCKRCKDDGMVCTTRPRKKTEYKQMPKGYAEVLENTLFALVATVHKLYAMVRNSQPWELGEPELDDRGQPVIHSLAFNLGCIRPDSDLDLAVHSVFPEDEAGLAELAAQLEALQQDRDVQSHITEETESSCNRSDRANSSQLEHSNFQQDYQRSPLRDNSTETGPQNLPNNTDLGSTQSNGFAVSSPSIVTSSPTWMAGGPSTSIDTGAQVIEQTGIQQFEAAYVYMNDLIHGVVEPNFGSIRPHLVSYPDQEMMMDIGDPMIYGGHSSESLRM